MVMTWCHSCCWHMMREDRYIFFVHHFVMSVLSWAWADMFHNWSDCISSPLDVSSGGTQWSVDCEMVLSLRLSSVTSADIFSAGGNVKHKIQNSSDATGTMKEIFFLYITITKIFSPVKLIIGLVCIKEKQFLYLVFKDWAVRIVFWIVWEWDKRKILQTIFVTPETIKYKTNSFLRAPGALQTSITNQSKLSNRKITLRLIRRVFQYFLVFCCISVRDSLVQSYLEVGGQALGWR